MDPAAGASSSTRSSPPPSALSHGGCRARSPREATSSWDGDATLATTPVGKPAAVGELEATMIPSFTSIPSCGDAADAATHAAAAPDSEASCGAPWARAGAAMATSQL